MPLPYKFHIRPQEAAVLLGPACDDLARLETRLAHYVDHIRLGDEDISRMRQAAAAVASALATVRSLRSSGREG